MLVNVASALLALAACASALPRAMPVSSSGDRPAVVFSPKTPATGFHKSPARTRRCVVRPSGQGRDDSQRILHALRKCSPHGRVEFLRGEEYTVGTALDLTFLRHIDIDIQGRIVFTDDMDYWQAHSFKYAFQNSSSFFRVGGEDVNIYGGGEVYGNGPTWWREFQSNKQLWRPILFALDGLKGGMVADLRLTDSPNWVNIVQDSQDVVFTNITIENVSRDPKYPAKNTDGWDTYRSDNIVIQNSRINNGDDCVSFKPNSTNILVQNLWCNGSHGISVGSLGQYVGKTDIVENITVYNIDMNNASDGARIKVFPGAVGGATDQGGGAGYVRNVTYENVRNTNNDWAIEVTQCYGQKNQTLCDEHPSVMKFEDILFKNFAGTTSKKHAPYVATVVCSSPEQCSNIRAENFAVKSPSGSTDAICTNMNNEELGLHCTSGKGATINTDDQNAS